jgi:hypothetical protein
MDESEVATRPFNGYNRKVVPLTSCLTKPPFQDARNLTHVPWLTTVSLDLNVVPPLFLTVSHVLFKDAKLP